MNYKIIGLVLVGSILLIGIFFIDSKSITGNIIFNQEETIIVPIKVHVVRDTSHQYTSYRDRDNVIKTIGKANEIWSQAGIYFQIEEMVTTDLQFEDIPNAINSEYSGLIRNKNFDNSKINIFFTQSLNNINGLALMGINSALIADYTTVNDYRATSHEFGHLLGLRHVEPSDRLMARGKNGEILDDWEIKIARENALRLV